MIMPKFYGPLNYHWPCCLPWNSVGQQSMCLPGALLIALRAMLDTLASLQLHALMLGAQMKSSAFLRPSWASYVAHVQGRGSFNSGTSVDATETQMAKEMMFVLWFYGKWGTAVFKTGIHARVTVFNILTQLNVLHISEIVTPLICAATVDKLVDLCSHSLHYSVSYSD